MSSTFPQSLAAVVLVFVTLAPLSAQQTTAIRLESSPSTLSATAGDSVRLRIVAVDAQGNHVDAPVRLAAPRSSVNVVPWYRSGFVHAIAAGQHEIVASIVNRDPQATPVMITIPITVRWPPVTQIVIHHDDARLYQGTTLRHWAEALHADGSRRPDAAIVWQTGTPGIVTVDRFGYVSATGTGAARIEASFSGIRGTIRHDVRPFPAAALTIDGGVDEVRTGDVQHFTADARDGRGRAVRDLPITWSFDFTPADGIKAPAAPGQVRAGKFVADVPGLYTVLASAGPLSARQSFRVSPRDVIRRVQVLGQGRIQDHYTSDFWVFEGLNGRDYALTGSRQAQSHAFVWDVTDPTNIFKTDSIQVDARSVNDVKVSPNGRYGVISREGASTRRNGVVILDLADPAHPRIASTFDQGLTGGVHNVFATNDYLFALSGGDKYLILDVRDLDNPTYVSEYDHPNSRIHDVWVHDGIAYSAEWQTGVVVVDVGNGRWGGSIENPKLVTTIPIPTGRTHAVFPYHQESTGKFYLFVGDEIIGRRGLAWEGTGPDVRMPYDPKTGRGGYPRATAGYIQIVDFTDPEQPEMVARYEVSEYGTHNMWIENDILYQAYYEGGVRMVDVSGDLMGNLYTQGREIAVFKAHDPIGWIPNAPAAWSVIPYKGNIFFSDNTSGLWSIKLQPKEDLMP